MMKMITENDVSKSFELVVTNGEWSQIHEPITHLIPELLCIQGRPDYVSTSQSVNEIDKCIYQGLLQASEHPASLRILSIIDESIGRTLEDLGKLAGLSDGVIRKAVGNLEKSNLAEFIDERLYAKTSISSELPFELTTFEIKLNNWKRALYQALQYKAFSHCVYVVFPDIWEHRFKNNFEAFERHGIGLISINLSTMQLDWICFADKKNPSSRHHYLYALSRFVREVKREISNH